MIKIERQIIRYNCPVTGVDAEHHILIADVKRKNVLISHANLFLYEKARTSICTSNRYSNILSMFYQFMSEDDRYKNVHISQYHAVADINTIKRWQVDRNVKRVKDQKTSPTSKTITEDAVVLANYFNYLKTEGYITNVDIKSKNYLPNWKNNTFLSHVKKKATKKLDLNSIKVLDKESRQIRLKTLITNDEIDGLLKAYDDPVYPVMFVFALETGMRPMDLVQFPHIGYGENDQIMPFSDMYKNNDNLIEFTVTSKGKKTRKVKINYGVLKIIEEKYIRPHYYMRALKYEKKFGKKCPSSILFLNKMGKPVTPKMIASRTNDAKKKAIIVHPNIRPGIVFYDSRHWWPTMFLVKTFKEKLLTTDSNVLFAAVAQVLIDQMGHSRIVTTYKHYIDFARFHMLGLKGYVNEIFSRPDLSVYNYTKELDGKKYA